MRPMRCPAAALLGVALLPGVHALSQEIPAVTPGWQLGTPTPGTHQLRLDLSSPHLGRGCLKITGTTAEGGARACVIQEFVGQTAIGAGKTYRYSVWYRTGEPAAGTGQVLIDAYGVEGEKSRQQLVLQRPAPAPEWRELSGEVTVPAAARRVRLLLYQHGPGTVWYDDAFFGEPSEGAANLLQNSGFEPPASAFLDLAPAKATGQVKFSADFANGVLGRVKEIGPDEFYLYALPEATPRSPFLWFHFRIDGPVGRELTCHLNPAPFSAEKTGGNGTRLPVASDDGDFWSGIESKEWNEDGTILSFRLRLNRSPTWVASFFPFTPEHVTRFCARYRGSPFFTVTVLGQSREGRDLRLYRIADPAFPEAAKRTVLFTTLQHDLETTGALALEGLCQFLLSDAPQAARLRQALTVYVVPMVDPDGIAGGNLYCPVGNLNRQWGLGTAPETGHVERLAQELAASGQPLDLFMDFHGWCTPERRTEFMTFGKEITAAANETDAVRLAESIRSRLAGKTGIHVWRHQTEFVTDGATDLRRLSCGWMHFEAGARLAYSIEIFAEGDCTQDALYQWGQAFAEGIAEFYGLGP